MSSSSLREDSSVLSQVLLMPTAAHCMLVDWEAIQTSSPPFGRNSASGARQRYGMLDSLFGLPSLPAFIAHQCCPTPEHWLRSISQSPQRRVRQGGHGRPGDANLRCLHISTRNINASCSFLVDWSRSTCAGPMRTPTQHARRRLDHSHDVPRCRVLLSIFSSCHSR